MAWSAQYASTCSHRFLSAISTRSPGATPRRASAAPRVSARSCSSAYVSRIAPSTTASAAGRRSAARSRSWARVRVGSSRGPQQDLALVPAIEHVLHGPPRVGQGERAVDDRAQAAVGEVLEHGAEFGERAEVGAHHGEVLRVDVAEVEPSPVRVVRADGDQGAQAREGQDALLERLAADVLDDDVDPALARPRLRRLHEVVGAIVHDLLGPEGP